MCRVIHSLELGVGVQNFINEFQKSIGNRQFSYREAIGFGIGRGEFYKAVKEGSLLRSQRGYYTFDDYFPMKLENQFQEVSQMVPHQSAICLLTALTYYNLTDEFVNTPILLVDYTVRLQRSNFSLFCKRNPKWNVGIVKEDGFNITSVERSIVESMVFKMRTGFEGYKALRLALDEGRTSIGKIVKMADRLGYKKRLSKNLEVFY